MAQEAAAASWVDTLFPGSRVHAVGRTVNIRTTSGNVKYPHSHHKKHWNSYCNTVHHDKDTDFPIQNLPYGVFTGVNDIQNTPELDFQHYFLFVVVLEINYIYF